MFSAPSNEDRVLTLTLENTDYEGLKETAEPDNETVNDVKLAQESAPKAPTLPTPANLKSATTKPVQEVVEPLPTIDQHIDDLAQEQIEQDHSFTEPFEQTEIDTKQVKPVNLETLLSPVSQADNETRAQFYTAKSSSLQINVNAASKGAEQNSSELIRSPKLLTPVDDPITETLNDKQYAKLEKKLNRLVKKFENLESVPEVLDWKDSGEVYTAEFTPLPAQTDMQMDEVRVDVFTERDGKKLTTSLRFKKLAFSNFAQFVNQWNPNVSIHDDVLDGRFHSNTKINLSADRVSAPLFYGKVTTASYQVNYEGRARKSKIFKGGLETGVKKIRMPRPRQLFSEKNDTYGKVVVLTQDARLIFTADGHYLWQAINEARPMEKHAVGEQPLYLMAAPSVSLIVSGTVNGAIVVYSPRRITIDGDITYQTSAGLEQGGDFLGLVSGRSVVIAKRDQMKVGDLTIHASIYASSRFAVTALSGKRSGTMNIFGSVSASTITATEPRYATNIVFDPRLENLRPPGFPVTDRYELVAKNNQWTVVQEPYLEKMDEQVISPAVDPGYLDASDEILEADF